MDMTDKLKLLGRDDILSADDLTRELVEIPEWGGSIYVRAMTGTERDAFETSCLKGKKQETDTTNIRAKLVARTACDEKRQRLFTNADMEALGKKSGKGLNRAWEVASRLSGIRDEDVEELEGN